MRRGKKTPSQALARHRSSPVGNASSLSELRCALFFEARRDPHSGGYTDVTPTVRDLLRQIKDKVEHQELV